MSAIPTPILTLLHADVPRGEAWPGQRNRVWMPRAGRTIDREQRDNRRRECHCPGQDAKRKTPPSPQPAARQPLASSAPSRGPHFTLICVDLRLQRADVVGHDHRVGPRHLVRHRLSMRLRSRARI